jgi:hypothetical protein
MFILIRSNHWNRIDRVPSWNRFGVDMKKNEKQRLVLVGVRRKGERGFRLTMPVPVPVDTVEFSPVRPAGDNRCR